MNIQPKHLHPSRHQLKRIYSALRRKPNVVACYLGFKYSGGRRRKSASIVCLVKEKKSHKSLGKRARIPESVTWRDARGHRHGIPTDVVKLRGPGTLCTPTSGPGDESVVIEKGSVGMAIRHPQFGNLVTTAGHCALKDSEGPGTYDFGPDPRPATLTNMASGDTQTGTALKAVCTVLCDYSLIRPGDPNRCTNFYRSGVRVLAPPTGAPSLGEDVTLLTSTGNERAAKITGIHAEMPIGKAGRMFDLIVTTPILIGGDSGGLLVTSNNEALGLAIGFVPLADRRIVSVFMPAAFVLDREAAEFV